MGTPNFAVATLSALLLKGYVVVGVITAPDRPSGRGRKVNTSAVKDFAIENRLPILQPNNLKDPVFLAALQSLGGNLQIVVAFRMLPRSVWALPEYGTFNLHASLLPDYRGAAPINWAIINGETLTGVTTFFIDEKIDTGQIILQKEIAIDENDTAGTLHDRLMDLGAALVIDTLKLIENDKVETKEQPISKQLKEAPKIYSETCEVNWNETMDQIHNLIRGLSPYPVACTHLVNGSESVFLKIYRSDKEKDSHNYPLGHIVADKHGIKIAVNGGYLHLLEIQLPGKRKMLAKEVLNGLKLEKNAKMA